MLKSDKNIIYRDMQGGGITDQGTKLFTIMATDVQMNMKIKILIQNLSLISMKSLLRIIVLFSPCF